MSNSAKAAPKPKPLTIMPPIDAVSDVVIADATQDDLYWMPLAPDVWTRPVLFNVRQGSWVNIIKARGNGIVSRHYHPAPVTGFTLDGAWHYPEHDWVATVGTFVYEPAGDTHTLTVHPSAGFMMCLFHNFGPIIYVDEEGRQVGMDDVFTRLEKFKAHCEQVGIAADYVKQMIR